MQNLLKLACERPEEARALIRHHLVMTRGNRRMAISMLNTFGKTWGQAIDRLGMRSEVDDMARRYSRRHRLPSSS